ncbi:MAG TPA: hypothetical protein VF551_01125, partial [Chthoniobacterales bacterium]
DVVGFEQAIAVLNGFNYRPAPVIQGYQAGNARLARLNGDYYRSPAAPEFVLLKLQEIDDHYPTLDNASILVELLHSYRYVLTERDWLLLQRSPEARPARLELIASGEVNRGERISIPPGVVWCTLQIDENWRGRLFRFLLHRPKEFVEVENGAVYPLPASMAQTPFLVSPLLDRDETFLRLLEGAETEPVSAISVAPGKFRQLLTQPTVKYQFFRVAE